MLSHYCLIHFLSIGSYKCCQLRVMFPAIGDTFPYYCVYSSAGVFIDIPANNTVRRTYVLEPEGE